MQVPQGCLVETDKENMNKADKTLFPFSVLRIMI